MCCKGRHVWKLTTGRKSGKKKSLWEMWKVQHGLIARKMADRFEDGSKEVVRVVCDGVVGGWLVQEVQMGGRRGTKKGRLWGSGWRRGGRDVRN